MRRRCLPWLSAAVLCAAAYAGETIHVAGWNVQSGGASLVANALRIADFDGVDLWGLCEVDPSWPETLRHAAETGEEADFDSRLGSANDEDRLLILYNEDRFRLVESGELPGFDYGGRVRPPLVAHLQLKSTRQGFYFMVNHLYRSDIVRRHEQARRLNQWAKATAEPVIAVGDYNFDWAVDDGERQHDMGYDFMTADGAFQWIRPGQLVSTQADRRFNTILDFVFISRLAGWATATSSIVVSRDDFKDEPGFERSDHRPVVATVTLAD